MADIEKRVAAALKDRGYVSPEVIEGWVCALLEDLAADGLVVVEKGDRDMYMEFMRQAKDRIDAMRPVVDAIRTLRISPQDIREALDSLGNPAALDEARVWAAATTAAYALEALQEQDDE